MSTNYYDLLGAALMELRAAAQKLERNTKPTTLLPRMRKFVLISKDGRHVSWPGSTCTSFRTQSDSWLGITLANEAIQIIAGNQPRLILRALRRIQAATAWCEARTEGRRRMAEEILRQQAGAIEALSAEAAMLALK